MAWHAGDGKDGEIQRSQGPIMPTSLSFRSRLCYSALAVATIAIGLVLHLRGDGVPMAVRDMLGDALWGAMIFWLMSVAAPATGLPVRIAAALAICFAVELGQLYLGADLVALRRTAVGHLVLGSDFDPRDFISYSLGILGAAALDRRISHRFDS